MESASALTSPGDTHFIQDASGASSWTMLTESIDEWNVNDRNVEGRIDGVQHEQSKHLFSKTSSLAHSA